MARRPASCRTRRTQCSHRPNHREQPLQSRRRPRTAQDYARVPRSADMCSSCLPHPIKMPSDCAAHATLVRRGKKTRSTRNNVLILADFGKEPPPPKQSTITYTPSGQPHGQTRRLGTDRGHRENRALQPAHRPLNNHHPKERSTTPHVPPAFFANPPPTSGRPQLANP